MDSSSITQLLSRLSTGDKQAESQLFNLVYRQLRKIAAGRMSAERADHTLQTTALVNEAYLRMVRGQPMGFESRQHFFAVAAQTMRRILVDHARARHAQKRHAEFDFNLDQCAAITPEPSLEVIALDEALSRLAGFDPRQAKIVEMRYFAGMSEDEIAVVLGVSSRTVKRDWTLAKAWLYGELRA